MSENDKKHDSQCCCCCQSWKAIFITITLLIIGAVFGHLMTEKHHRGRMGMMHPSCCPMMSMGQPCGPMMSNGQFCPMMMGPGGGDYGIGGWRDMDRINRECEGKFESRCREGKEQKGFESKGGKKGKCKPGCTCPKCSERSACLSDPNKPACPMKK